MVSGAAWIFIPQFGIGFSLIALLPWLLRLLAGRLLFQGTLFDWLIAIFLITAWVGYWAAYDKTTAWIKFWLIVSAILLYYALYAQPRQNFGFLSFLSFCFALALSLYFFLSYEFTGEGELAVWWIHHRPQLGWPAMHHGHSSGLLLISSLFAFYWLWRTSKKAFGAATAMMQLLLIVGMGMVALVFVLTFSRGIEVIVIGGVGLWILWKISVSARYTARVRVGFPILVLSYLAALIIFAYFGTASATLSSGPSNYGINSRAELLGRGAYFLAEYPITGAGLASFPGLYSQYILVIPYFYFTNSYNLFLDIAIEQGLLAGSVFVILYLSKVWLVSQAIVSDPSDELRLLRWLSLFILLVTIVHGLFYDYLYNGYGTILLFYPLGITMIGCVSRNRPEDRVVHLPNAVSPLNRMMTGTLLAIIAVLALNLNTIVTLWYANLGAVQMSQAQLKDFPSDQWASAESVSHLEMADTTLHTALRYDSHNLTANYRLGLISMLRWEFETAAANLETAYQETPNHRGIIKSLGYCYVWLGDIDKAKSLLDRIPEAKYEMNVYVWWWGKHGRPDLAEKASIMISRLGRSSQ